MSIAKKLLPAPSSKPVGRPGKARPPLLQAVPKRTSTKISVAAVLLLYAKFGHRQRRGSCGRPPAPPSLSVSGMECAPSAARPLLLSTAVISALYSNASSLCLSNHAAAALAALAAGKNRRRLRRVVATGWRVALCADGNDGSCGMARGPQDALSVLCDEAALLLLAHWRDEALVGCWAR